MADAQIFASPLIAARKLWGESKLSASEQVANRTASSPLVGDYFDRPQLLNAHSKATYILASEECAKQVRA